MAQALLPQGPSKQLYKNIYRGKLIGTLYIRVCLTVILLKFYNNAKKNSVF